MRHQISIWGVATDRMKISEDDESVIVRSYEAEGFDSRARLRLARASHLPERPFAGVSNISFIIRLPP
jgi:hypothetical protein